MGIAEERNRGRQNRTSDPRVMLSRGERESERERREKLTAQNSREEFKSELRNIHKKLIPKCAKI
jgi:hypothetical protein